MSSHGPSADDLVCDPSHRFCVSKSVNIDEAIQDLLKRVKARDPHEKEFLQALEEVIVSLKPVLTQHPYYIDVLETLAEPEQVHYFRVPWIDDNGRQQVNRGFRVQYSSALGPFKGGLRFHPSVNLSVVKFLGFEQIFKNSLTGLPLGGGKGGSDFDPKNKSDGEVLRFCQSFITSLFHHIGPSQDIPAGDIGVGSREIGYMYGMYKRLTRQFEGTMTGKNTKWGGSYLRTEATGYGVVYFTDHVMADLDTSLEGKTCLISGSGNVAQYCCEKLLQGGAKVVTMSDSSGYIHVPSGMTKEMLQELFDLKQRRRGRISEMADKFDQIKFFKGKKPWEVAADVALPCATQNEVTEEDAQTLVKNGLVALVEGANMPCTSQAVKRIESAGVAFGPAKAANAGGVAVSGLEMAQN
ncbi:glutamate dehydrogenase, partial [Salpingoeca rosetta]